MTAGESDSALRVRPAWIVAGAGTAGLLSRTARRRYGSGASSRRSAMTVEEAPGRGQVRVIGLIALAHGASHFYQLALPPLFPHLKEAFAVSYTELGTLMTVFYVSSGLSQTAAGFLVDRFSARTVLLSGLALLCVAIVLMGFAPAFWMLFPLAVLAGIGNCVFHPADLSILTASIRRTRHGRAYGFHTLGGNLGYALAPIVMVGLALELGWRSALTVAGATGLILFLVLALNRHLFLDARDEAHPVPAPPATAVTATGAARRGPLAAVRQGFTPLLSAPVLLCFAFFVLLSGATIGLQSFFPALMDQLYGLPIAEGAPLLSVFLFGASGGVTARRLPRRACGRTASGRDWRGPCIGRRVLRRDQPRPLPGRRRWPLPFALAGIMVGLTMPSRDMLVRESAAASARGRVFGFVYSGLDTGAAAAPLIVGLLLDHGNPRAVLWLIAALLLLAIVDRRLWRKGRRA